MLFTADITVPANTPKTAPKVETVKIAHGVVTWVSVLFPSGCHQMVDAVVSCHGTQIYPSTEGMTMTGDTKPVEWTEFFEVYQPPYEVKVELWSPGTTNDHTVSVRIAILPRRAIVATALADLAKRIGALFGARRGPVTGPTRTL